MVIKINYTSSDVYVSTSVSPVYVVVNYSGVSGGGAAWGEITGTLSDQTDLQDALDAKFDDPTGTTAQYLRGDGSLATFPTLTGYVPYTGATADVNLGEYELKAGQVEFDQTPTGTAGVGVMRWNDTDGTVDLGLKGGNVTLQVGQEQILRVVNKTGANLLESQYRAVRIRLASEGGTQGQRLAVVLAQGNNDANSADTIGIVTENIDNNQEGFICTSGLVRDINTTGSLQGETWADGDIIYLSPTTAGAITKVKPTAPSHSVILGYVVYAHANNGKIFVKCDNGYELGELHNVYVPTPSNNDGIFWNSTNLRYENKTVAGALGYTPISGSGVSGQVAYWNGTGSQTGSNNLFWDAANNRLGIGTATPTDKLHVAGTAKFTDNVSIVKASNPYLLIDNTGTGGKSFTFVSASDGTFQLQNTNVSTPLTILYTGESTFSNSVTANQLIINNVNTPAAKFYRNVDVGTFGEAGQGIEFGAKSGSTYVSSAAIYGGLEASGTSGNLSFRTLNSGTLTERARFTAAGRLLLGLTAESTYLLDVNGTARVSGNVTISNAALFVTPSTSDVNASGLVILKSTGANAGASLFLKDNTNSNFLSGFNIDSSNVTRISNFVDTGELAFSTTSGGTGADKMRIFSNGNILIQNGGTFTNNGFRLDVNGTSRVSGKITANGSTTSTSGLDVGTMNHQFFATNNAFIGENTFYNGSAFQRVNTGLASVFYFAGGGFQIGTLPSGTAGTTQASLNARMSLSNTGSLAISDTISGGGSITHLASAVLQVDSTTKGFLPPRMTNAQRAAISSPAVGLIVYCTDATEGLYEYTSAGWVNLNGVVTNRQTASYTLALTDVNDLVEMNVATANNLTVPLNSSIAFPIGTKIDIAQYGAGQTTIVATGGVTVRSAGGALKLTSQYSGATLVKIATDEWYLFGNITT